MRTLLPQHIPEDIRHNMKLALNRRQNNTQSHSRMSCCRTIWEKLNNNTPITEEDLNNMWAYLTPNDYPSYNRKKWAKDFKIVRDIFDMKIFEELGT